MLLFFFDLQPSCIPQPGVYSLFYSIYLIVWTSTLPDGLILIFTLWTLKNVKQTRLRIATNRTTNTSQQRRIERTKAQLIVVS
jgi:formate-dependent nitrite reductase membrane component NrfD